MVGPAAGTLRLRPFRDEDLNAVITWVRDADELELFAGPALTWPLTVSQLRRTIATPGLLAYTLIDSDAGDEPLGHVELATVPTTGTEPRLARVLLAPAVRGRGWAARLVALALEEARAQGLRSLALTVIATNEAAIRTYMKLGFVMVDRPRPDALAMRLDL